MPDHLDLPHLLLRLYPPSGSNGVLPSCRVCSFLGNLAGTLFIVFLLFETRIFGHEADDGKNFAMDTAILKTSADFGATVVKGILANWLVSPTFLTCCMYSIYIGL